MTEFFSTEDNWLFIDVSVNRQVTNIWGAWNDSHNALVLHNSRETISHIWKIRITENELNQSDEHIFAALKIYK